MTTGYSVYVHVNKNTNKKYVGITSQEPKRRWRSGAGYMSNQHFYRAIKRDGWENFHHYILYKGLDKKTATDIEQRLVAEFYSNNENYGYNKSLGGENPAQGHKHSEETRKKMSEAHKGKTMTPAQRENMKRAAKKRGNGKSGKTGKECHKAGVVRQIDITTGELVAEYFGFYEMQRKTGFGISPIMRAAKGEQKQSHGYKWEYIPRRNLDVVV